MDDVVNSPMIADPLHRLDCCVITDGGGALVVVAPEVAKRLKRPRVRLLGAGEATKHQMGGKIDLTYTGAARSGATAFAEAGVTPADIKYVSIYDSFTITVLICLEDLASAPGAAAGASWRTQLSPARPLPSIPTAAASAITIPPSWGYDQGDRGGAPAPRRGASQGAGTNCGWPWRMDRRLARHAARQRHRHPGGE